MRACVACLIALLPITALSAEVTEMPKELRGIGSLTYGAFAEWGALSEEGVKVGKRRISRHDLHYALQFAPINGAAIVLDIDHTPSLRYTFPESNVMLIEPVEGGGTYIGGEQVSDTPTVKAGGLNGIWIGAAFQPFSESYEQYDQQSTWRLDIAFRTGSSNRNLWTAPNGSRGAAPGGSALKLAGAVSTEMGIGNPYVSTTWVKENKVTVDLTDEDGVTHATDVELNPASTIDFRGGIEVIGYRDASRETRAAVDFFLGMGYRSWEDIASGVYLPDVLPGSRQIAVTASEQINMMAGINVDYHVNDKVRARTGPDFRFHTPFRPEHVYNTQTTPDHLGFGWVFKIEGVLDVSPKEVMAEFEEAAETP